ncbi:MAG: radical SAM protein [Treponemataceae bacterium]
MMRVFLVQPPFVQLNAPYPAPYYLRAFLSSRGTDSLVADHSIALFERLFSRSGLETVFAATRPIIEARLSAPPQRTATIGHIADEEAVRLNLSRYLSQSRAWINTVDRLIAFLRGEDREFGHLLSAANGSLPAGARTERLVEALGGQPAPDDARRLATAMLADLADLVSVVLDPGFSLVRYAESMAASVRRFDAVESAVDGWVLKTFYEPLLAEEWDRIEREFTPTESRPFILACTVPFPGCLAGALAAARSTKARFGDRVRTVAGGGYVNTELRSITSTRFFGYFDFLSFDRGYGSLEAILELGGARPAGSLYKTIYRDNTSGVLVGSPNEGEGSSACNFSEDAAKPVDTARFEKTDAESPKTVFPDYRGVDFSRYILPVDDENPMHRLWSDGRWMKAYLAHGCYWAACAFCDVSLDYIHGFLAVEPDALFAHLVAQAAETGIRGVHLVDEAAPVASLLRLAELNRAAGLPLVFWGNIRFERGFTPDVAAVLAAGGLLGVSAGIEIASERGFKRLGKGIGLGDVVRACAAFKEAGILVHAYLIFGFWDENDGEIVDSVETMRQVFAAGLVDSAFWHKFVLTRHSRVMREWKNGKHPELKPIEGEVGVHAVGVHAVGDFADNDLRFEGEHRTDRWSSPLDALVAAWMTGEALDRPVAEAIPFKTPKPGVAADLIVTLLDDYARDRDADRSVLPPALPAVVSTTITTEKKEWRALFLGSDPVAETLADGRVRLRWTYRMADRWIDMDASLAEAVKKALNRAAGYSGPTEKRDLEDELRSVLGDKSFRKIWPKLREGGFVIV